MQDFLQSKLCSRNTLMTKYMKTSWKKNNSFDHLKRGESKKWNISRQKTFKKKFSPGIGHHIFYKKIVQVMCHVMGNKIWFFSFCHRKTMDWWWFEWHAECHQLSIIILKCQQDNSKDKSRTLTWGAMTFPSWHPIFQQELGMPPQQILWLMCYHQISKGTLSQGVIR